MSTPGFAKGYQAALEDIAASLAADGVHGVCNWLADNLGREDLRQMPDAQKPLIYPAGLAESKRYDRNHWEGKAPCPCHNPGSAGLRSDNEWPKR